MFEKKLGEIRPNQLITTYGPGAIVDAINDSLTVLDISYWREKGTEINDIRLANYLKVKKLYSPKTGGKEDIPVVSFPYKHVCANSKCRAIFDVREHFDIDHYNNSQGQVKCPYCGWDSFPSRFIVICEDGHMDDFPWRWWCHYGDTSCKKTIRLKSTGKTSSLAELVVECDCGNARRSMIRAMSREQFSGLKCSGNHPHRPGTKCSCHNKPVIPCQRGASNVYFPVIRNAISIPPYTNPINDIMSAHREAVEKLAKLGKPGLDLAYDDFFSEKFSREEFDSAYERLSEDIKEFTELKEMEYMAITHHEDVKFQHDVKHFKAEEVNLLPGLKKYISRVIKIHRLREVRVLTGFTRLETAEPDVEDGPRICKLKPAQGEKWLPAVAVHGEGVFIELNRETVADWTKIPCVGMRSGKYEEYYGQYCENRGWEHYKKRNAEYVLLHTFSHLLIKEMALVSGYSSAALSERIYSNEKMCGLLIYTGAADKEGSLGGLVEQGGMEKFVPLVRRALENALTCTTDPECFMKNPTSERLNGAACHSCSMISETACECGNRLLDRAFVTPIPGHEEMAYFRGLVNNLCGTQI